MAIQTEVTLQPDNTCCLHVMGENHALQKRFLSLSVWSTGTAQAYREYRFGRREIKVPSAPIFF